MVRLTAPALAVDLGTANTLVYELGKGIVLNEPSVAAVWADSREVIAVGSEAPATLGDGNSPITLVRPLAAGVISDIDVAERMLSGFVDRVVPPRRLGSRPHLVVAVPSSVTGVDRRAVADAVYAAGAATVELVEEPIAAAIGAGLPVEEPIPSVIVDIGGGTTEVAMIADGGIVVSASAPVGGNALDQAIIDWMRKEHALLVGDRAAEQLKIAVGSAWPRRHEREADIRGRDLVSGLPGTVTVGGGDVRVAMDQPLAEILAAVRNMLNRCPPDLTAELDTRGLLITGGGALLSGLTERLADATGLPVTVADRPLECVVLGAATYLGWYQAGIGRRGTSTQSGAPCHSATPTTAQLASAPISLRRRTAPGNINPSWHHRVSRHFGQESCSNEPAAMPEVDPTALVPEDVQVGLPR